jgi:hypothetical protein
VLRAINDVGRFDISGSTVTVGMRMIEPKVFLTVIQKDGTFKSGGPAVEPDMTRLAYRFERGTFPPVVGQGYRIGRNIWLEARPRPSFETPACGGPSG